MEAARMVARRYFFFFFLCRVTSSSYNHSEPTSLYDLHLESHAPGVEPIKPRKTRQLAEKDAPADE